MYEPSYFYDHEIKEKTDIKKHHTKYFKES